MIKKYEQIVETSPLAFTHEPPWAGAVERWYQLDELSWSFCQALDFWKPLAAHSPPEAYILAIEGGSQQADLEFVASGATSPAKFVYTLPNVCMAVMFQLLGTDGKVYSFNKGSQTLEFACAEAQMRAHHGRSTWVLASDRVSPTQRKVQLQIFESHSPAENRSLNCDSTNKFS